MVYCAYQVGCGLDDVKYSGTFFTVIKKVVNEILVPDDSQKGERVYPPTIHFIFCAGLVT